MASILDNIDKVAKDWVSGPGRPSASSLAPGVGEVPPTTKLYAPGLPKYADPSTARGIGYRGTPAGLSNCGTGIHYGMMYLKMAYKQAGGNVYRADPKASHLV